MTSGKTSVWQSLLKASLWLCSIGLMVSSSGLDGAYLSKLMPAGWAWLGLMLNTVADVTSEVGMYWYGRLRVDKSTTKQKNAKWILVGEGVLVFYAWLFGWRQLVPIIAKIDPDAPQMAWAGAAFIPAALVVVGYILSQLAGRIEKPKVEQVEQEEAVAEAPEPEPLDRSLWPRATFEDAQRVTAGMNGERATLTYAELKRRLTQDEKSTDKQRSSVYRWKDRIKQEEVERAN